MADRSSKTALITGASSGMGKAIANRLLEDGYQVFAAARRVDKMQDLAQTGAIPLRMDISKDEEIVAAVQAILERSGGVDVLVNNAGFGLYGPVEEVTIDEARYQFEVNVFGAARLTQLLLLARSVSSPGSRRPVGAEPDAAADATFAAILELGRRGTGRHIVPIRVEMTRPGAVTAAHRDYFRAPIVLGAPRNALVLDRDDLDRPFAGHNPELLDILTPALAASLDEIGAQNSLADQVKIVLKRRLASGKPDLEDVARELGTSERTLQRRITEAGSTFRKLLEESRYELGRQMLSERQNGIDEIAFLLGYQDTSSFYRAFRSWEGVTPAQWRSLH